NFHGEVGSGDSMKESYATPVDVVGLSSGVAQVATGGGTSCALLATGAVQCWGDDGVGQLGDATQVGSNVPRAVPGVASATLISVGATHVCALVAAGGVVCWGDDGNAERGDGTTQAPPQPSEVYGL